MNDRYVSPLSERYASREMQYIFSPDKKFRTWRKLWIALAETEYELGLSSISREQIEELKAHAEDINYDVAKAERGIIYIDEIDKIASSTQNRNSDVSREGVQRDLLPIVEGSQVNTKYGLVHTDHILFIAAGAFHFSKPSDMIPELQGRFPLRVELKALDQNDFFRILTEPDNALTKQYSALLGTENVVLEYTDDGLQEIASFAEDINARTENIGARRLYTIMEKILAELSFDAPSMSGAHIVVDKKYVNDHLEDIKSDQDLSRYIL